MRYVLITSARNEAAYIERTIQSVVAQTVLPIKWLIVNDGSDDNTPAIIDGYARQHHWIERLDMPAHPVRSFAAKAHCFNAGYDRVRHLDFEVVGNLDADLSFEPDYFEFLLAKFAEMPRLGVAGTVFHEPGYDSGRDSFAGLTHVAGQCQMFRRQCFDDDIGGYVPNPSGGIDWIAVTTARMKHWQTRSFREKHFFHHRRLGTAERTTLAAHFARGQKDYYLGNHPLWQLFRIAYRTGKKPVIVGSLGLATGYLYAVITRTCRPISPELMRFHRQEQMTKLRTIATLAMHFRKIDHFSLSSKE